MAIRSTLTALALAAATAAFAGDSLAQGKCVLTIPEPPKPLPPNFDWRPLAKDWCRQLSACGFDLPDCVGNYLANLPLDRSAAATGPLEDNAAIDLQCEQSEEAALDPAICTPYAVEEGARGEPPVEPLPATPLTPKPKAAPAPPAKPVPKPSAPPRESDETY